MPKQGQSVETCLLLEWNKKKGEQVGKGEILFTYETDKASFEYESPASGTLLETFFNEQDDVPVHTIVAAVGEPGENIEQFRPAPAVHSDKSPDRVEQSAVSFQENTVSKPASSEAVPTAGPAAASPRARRKAALRRIDLSNVTGSGPGGRIIERDILALPAIDGTAGTLPEGKGLLPEMDDTVSEVAVSKVRKIIGERMQHSLLQSAQLTMNAFADATGLLSCRRRFKADNADITITDMIAMAVAQTLLSHPELNALYREEKIFRYGHVHLAMAVDTPRGLMVPVVRFADQLPLERLSAMFKELSAKCREGSINPDLLNGGTFTISNLGSFGIESFTPILNPPQVALLGVNAISLRPVGTEEGGFALRPHIGFSLTIDHRVVDGAPGARFLKSLCDTVAEIDAKLAV